MFCKIILLVLFLTPCVSSLELCKADSSCKCENGLIAECEFTTGSIVELKLINIPPTNFSTNFYISNVDTEAWPEVQKQDDTKLLIVNVIDSPIRNYSNLLLYLETMNIGILHLLFRGVGFAEVDNIAFRELLMGTSETLESLQFDDYLPSAAEIDLRGLQLDKLEVFEYYGRGMNQETVYFDSVTTATAENQHLVSINGKATYMSRFLIRNAHVGNVFLKYYIDRTANRQYFEWAPLLSEEDYFIPHIFSSPYPPKHWYEDVVIKLGPNHDNTAPKILTKDFLLHAGAVTLLCLPDTLEQIEYGALSTMTDMKAYYIGRYSVSWSGNWQHGCLDVVNFADMTTHGRWFSLDCRNLPWFQCQLCFMHNFGLHKTEDNVPYLCSSKSFMPSSMIRQCYWDDPTVVTQLPGLPLLGPLLDEERKPNCPPYNFGKLSIREKNFSANESVKYICN